jgi:hypothetical protein
MAWVSSPLDHSDPVEKWGRGVKYFFAAEKGRDGEREMGREGDGEMGRGEMEGVDRGAGDFAQSRDGTQWRRRYGSV